MPPTIVHIITHTHWDREWFLTSAYTSRWIPGLIDNLEALVAENPGYKYLFDGQTLVIEDLLKVAPEYVGKVHSLVEKGNLIIGPYYCQPDWQLSGGELLIRNLMYGLQDLQEYGGAVEAGWLVDTFGHTSQSPQIHSLFGIEALFVWRGVPQLEPYFHWQAPDGSRQLTIYLFGGYRNLYGVTHAPEVAVRRLHAEVEKLSPFYPTADIPLFDGYDLEDNPEDPFLFYSQIDGIGTELTLQESTPALFARVVREKQLSLPVLTSELNSGKYGATFPGTLSTRNYLKVMAHDCEHLLYQVCEPLAVLARLKGREYNTAQYEAWSRILLQNAVHDAICGVSIDQVHQKMEYHYRQVFEAMRSDAQDSLASILREFTPGEYLVSTNPFPVDSWQVVSNELIHIKTPGVGVWPVDERVPVENLNQPVETFAWRNDHYEVTVRADGLVRTGDAVLGSLEVSREKGDAYSGELGQRLAVLPILSPLTILQKSDRHCILGFTGEWRSGADRVTASIRLQFDPSPLIRWDIDLDSRGTGLRVDMVFETAIQGERYAGMPFDLVRRPVTDTDLLPSQLPDELSSVLLGQRELGSVSTFPFQEVLAVSDGQAAACIFVKGIHAYEADESGTVQLILRRTVEWLTKADLKGRAGDAGPFFYVPDARCERVVSHTVAVSFGRYSAASMELQALNAAFQNPPLIVRGYGAGSQTSWQVFHEQVSMSSLSIVNGEVQARFYNPTTLRQPLTQPYLQTGVWGEALTEISTVQPKKIVTVRLPATLPEVRPDAARVECYTLPVWRVGENAALPDPQILAGMEEKIAVLEQQIAEVESQLAKENGNNRLRLQHRYYVLKRECVEFKFSLLLNRRKLRDGAARSDDYILIPDEEIAALGLELNQLRIKRRIYDYIVQAITPGL